jgi:formylglycine-generating enzyme required for sulfatase activity
MELDLGGGMTMKLALIPAGEFLMGSPAGEAGRGDHEGPQHRVRITKAFYMGATQVTQEQYQAVMGKNPSWFKGAKNPVEQVSWNDAQEFCRRLSAKTGKTVRLPTEAEWEYACRAGTTTKWSCGDQEGALGEYAWHGANAGERTHDVGGKKPNAFGLYDMHGNVFEWCQDWCDASYYANSPLDDPSGAARGYARALRGGSWNVTPEICRSAYRFGYGPGLRFAHLGFRAVVSVAGGLD